ncbi:MAG: response regulator [Nitrospira sp.]|nr:response regulator [Nitrospira sp.]
MRDLNYPVLSIVIETANDLLILALEAPMTSNRNRINEGYGKRVLVIDDAQDIRHLTCLALSDAGYNVYSAADGLDGLEEMKKRRYDTVLVDNNMPRLNGGQFIAIAHVTWPDTPIILMSGDWRSIDRLDAVEGIYARISKPCELPKLLDLIAHVSNGDQLKDIHLNAYQPSFLPEPLRR